MEWLALVMCGWYVRNRPCFVTFDKTRASVRCTVVAHAHRTASFQPGNPSSFAPGKQHRKSCGGRCEHATDGRTASHRLPLNPAWSCLCWPITYHRNWKPWSLPAQPRILPRGHSLRYMRRCANTPPNAFTGSRRAPPLTRTHGLCLPTARTPCSGLDFHPCAIPTHCSAPNSHPCVPPMTCSCRRMSTWNCG